MLEAGRHVFACMHGFDDGTNHLSRGMLRAFTVIARPPPASAERAPHADATITMNDYGYKLTGKLSAGRRMIRLVNAGPQEHHMMLQKMLPGRTLAEVNKWQEGGRKGERPVRPIFWGTTRQSKGATLYATVDLEPGGYVLVCLVPDAADGKPHAEHGMRGEIQVGGTAPDALPGRVVDVKAGEFFFQAVDTIPEGLTTFRLQQIGLVVERLKAGAKGRAMVADKGDNTRGAHMLWVVKLGPGKTMADLYKAAQAGDRTNDWAKYLGGASFTLPPRSSNVTLDLNPGNYVLVCFVGSARADRTRYHFLNGMSHALTVVAGEKQHARMPEADILARISGNGSVELSSSIASGQQVIRVRNTTAKDYEFKFQKVPVGSTGREMLADSSSIDPGIPWGGLSSVPAGATVTTTIDFDPGEYLLGTHPPIRHPTSQIVKVSQRR